MNTQPQFKTVDTDLRLGVHESAWAVLHLLANWNLQIPIVFDFRVSALYQGRRRGIVVTVNCLRRDGQRLHVYVGEYPGSDDIEVVAWDGDLDIDPPTEIPPKAFTPMKDNLRGQAAFLFNEVGQATQAVKDVVVDYIEANKKSWR